MKCPDCDRQNPEDARFCNGCGSKLELACPDCGKTNPPGSRFCNGCGQNLGSPSEPAIKELSFDEKIDKIQRYLPKGLTEKILSQKNRIEGEHKQVTVMFCDMVGFTPLVERVGPEKAYGIMDDVYEILIHKVHDYDGTVNEMTGDGIMALFGAPIALEDAPQRAIRSALSIHREMAKFSEKMKQKQEGLPLLRMRIGIHTGPVVVGTLGNDLRVEFKAVGDTVNLASRMEGLAKPGTTYVTEEAFRAAEGFFRFEALGKREVKGKTEPLNTYQVIAPSTSRTRFDVSADRGLTPFIGRARELELLIDGLDRVRGGRGQAFSIVAEAGVGKSRLLYEFRKAVANEDITFLEGKCLSYSRGVVYHLQIDILKANFDIREGDGDLEIKQKVEKGLQTLGMDEDEILPYLLDLLSVKDSGIDSIAMGPEARRRCTIGALKRIVIKGSQIRPLILAYEDLHWVDSSSEEVLKDLFESIPRVRVLMIFTYRPEFVHTWGGKSYHNQLNLNRLSNRESLALVKALLGTEHVESALEEFILEKTEGTPFFIEEFIRSMGNLRIIERNDNAYRIAKAIQTVAIPATIQDVIMARVDSLPEMAKNILQAGSVVGREFSHELINSLLSFPETDLLSNLSLLKDAELLYERGIYPQSVYIFKHALTQDVVYSSLLFKRRKEIHEQIGTTMEELYTQKLDEYYEIMAHHYSNSTNSAKTYHYLKLSGNKCTQNHSLWEAFHFFKEALNILKEQPFGKNNKKEQIQIRILLSVPMHLLGHPEDSFEILEEGARISNETDDKRSLSIFYSKLGAYYALKGDPLKAVEYSDDSYNTAKKTQDIEIIAPVACELCVSNIGVGKFFRIIEVVSKVLADLEKTHRQRDSFGMRYNAYSGLCAYGAFAQATLGHFEEGKTLVEKGLLFADNKNRYALGWVELCYGLLYLYKGDGKKVVKHVERSIKHLDEAQAIYLSGLAWAGFGFGYYLLGELDTAEKHVKMGLKLHKDAGMPIFLSWFPWMLGMIYFNSNDLEKAQDSLEEAVNISQSRNEKHNEAITSIWLGRILGKSEASANRGEECILQGMRISKELKLKPFSTQGHLFLGEIYASTGQGEKAVENLKKAIGMFQDMGMDYWVAKTQEVLEKV